MCAQRYQHRYRHILVDEFQDTNRAQYELVQASLAEAHKRNIFVVGDEDQSIYSWRGADFRNVLRFRQDYPRGAGLSAGAELSLDQTILEAARQ